MNVIKERLSLKGINTDRGVRPTWYIPSGDSTLLLFGYVEAKNWIGKNGI
jgi:hypothetical protein